MAEKSLQQEEEEFKAKRKMLEVTADWWFKEINEAMAKVEEINNNKIEASDEEREELENRIKYLSKKADFETKERNKLQKEAEKLLCKKISSSFFCPPPPKNN